MSNYIINHKKSQEKIYSIADRKKDALIVADSFLRLGQSERAIRMKHCADALIYEGVEDTENFTTRARLLSGDWCRERLCPMCMWRRSREVYQQAAAVMSALSDSKYRYRFLMLTLTIPSCRFDELSDYIRKLSYSYNQLTKRAAYKRAVLGSFRAIEVTYNSDEDIFHPHIHSIQIVPEHYGDDPLIFLKSSQWWEMWESVTGFKHCNIDLRELHNATSGGVAEVCKYSCKPADMIARRPDGTVNIALTDYIVGALHNGMRGKRLITYTGLMQVYRKRLGLSDEELTDDFIEKCSRGVLYRWGGSDYTSNFLSLD